MGGLGAFDIYESTKLGYVKVEVHLPIWIVKDIILTSTLKYFFKKNVYHMIPLLNNQPSNVMRHF